jgi:hypothetical protein
MVDWVSTFLCTGCNVTRQVVRVLEEGTDPETGNPYQEMELVCGHIQKRLRVSKEIRIGYNEILNQIDKDFTSQSERQELKKIVGEIISDLKSIRFPHSSLEKLKRYQKIYNLALPWVMKAIDFAEKHGWFDIGGS